MNSTTRALSQALTQARTRALDGSAALVLALAPALALALCFGCGGDEKPQAEAPAAASALAAPEPAPVPAPEEPPAAPADAPAAAAAEPEVVVPPGDATNGLAVFTRSCVACHGADGRGNGGMTGADLVGDKTRLAKSDGVLFTSIKQGSKGKTLIMPPHKDLLSDTEISDALAYVRATFAK